VTKINNRKSAIAGFIALCEYDAMSLHEILAKIVVPALLLLSCSPASIVTATPWMAPPDREWSTRIVKHDNDGPGINSLYESVELKRYTATKGMHILTIDEGDLSGDELRGPAIITLHWRDDASLEINYRAGNAGPVSQVPNLLIEARPLVVQR
jgi:hypothetical protein